MSPWETITKELIDKKAITETELHAITPPNNRSDIIPILLKSGVSAKFIAQVIANVCHLELYQGLQVNEVIIDGGVLYLENPLDNFQIQEQIISLNKGDADFGSVGITISDSKQNKEHQSTLLNDLINLALDNDATDIHASPRNKDTIYIKIRIQGQLINAYDDVSFDNYEVFINLILNKIGKNAGVFNHPVDGQFSFSDHCSVRVSLLPVNYRFKDGFIVPRITLRIITTSEDGIRSLSDLSLLDYSNQQIAKITQRKQGLIYITGPTGSGKSTLAYMLIKEIQLKMPNMSIATVEDPIENNLPGVEQTQINEKAGVTFAIATKAFMRLDPDVLLVGETRDEITAKNTMTLANTGHLTLSTLHTNDAISAVSRLHDLGISYGQISDKLSTVIATRLVRKLCHCANSVQIDSDNEIYQRINNYLSLDGTPITIKEANGCDDCCDGYTGRISICEIFNFDKQAKTIIATNFNQNDLIEHFIQTQLSGFFWSYGFNLLINDLVSYRELIFLLPEDVLFTNHTNKTTIKTNEVKIKNEVITDDSKDDKTIDPTINDDSQEYQTIHDISLLFIDQLQSKKPKGVKTQINKIEKVTKKFGSNQTINSLSIESIEKFRTTRLDSIKERSANEEAKILMQLLKFYNQTGGQDQEQNKNITEHETDSDSAILYDELSDFFKIINEE